jgi:hypothetical protein
MLMRFVRYGLPLVLLLVGIAFLIIQPNSTGLEGFCAGVGAALALLLLNVLFRAGVTGDRDRDREEAARAYFDEHGHWPDEAPRWPRSTRPASSAATARASPARRRGAAEAYPRARPYWRS